MNLNILSQKKKGSIFFQKVLRYKRQERQLGYGNLNKSPMKLPINPNDIVLQISALSPFNKSSENFFKKEIKRFDKVTHPPDVCITDRGEQKDRLDIFNSPKIRYSPQNNNIFDNYDYYQNEENYNDYINENDNIFDYEELKDNIKQELNESKRLNDFLSGYFENISEKQLSLIQPNVLYNIIKINNKILSLLKLFYIYDRYNLNEDWLKKKYFKKWKKAVNFINLNFGYKFHILNKSGHCISAKNIVIQEIRCGIYPNNKHHIDCLCLKIGTNLKKILIRHYLLKFWDERKYYLFKWYKNTFKKIRPLYIFA